MFDCQGQQRLKNKIAVVTGAGAGIGQGCAIMFAAQGAKVIAIDVDGKALDDTNSQTAAIGGVRTIRADLTSHHSVTETFDRIKHEEGRIDVLVNAAAFATFKWIEDLSLEEWKSTLAGELDIVFLPTKAAWPSLKASRRASIINFASANAHMTLEGSPALAHCAGKGGILAMTRQLAMEGSPHGIRANTISPGLIVTDATRRHMEIDPAFESHATKRMMIKRMGQPIDIAWCATWLAADESSYVTGADISVDGGATAW